MFLQYARVAHVPNGSQVSGELYFEGLCSLADILFPAFSALDHVDHSGGVTGCITLYVVSFYGDFTPERLLVNHFVVQWAVSVCT